MKRVKRLKKFRNYLGVGSAASFRRGEAEGSRARLKGESWDEKGNELLKRGGFESGQ
jgi:hypothetical protein